MTTEYDIKYRMQAPQSGYYPEDSEIDDCLQIYTSLLYCKGEFVWSGMTT